jgi:hypothetical protein
MLHLQSLAVLAISLVSYVPRAYAHAAISPMLGVSGTPARSDVQRPLENIAPCGKVSATENLDTSTPVQMAADGTVTMTITNFNPTIDGSREIKTALVDTTGTGNSFNVQATMVQNGDGNPQTDSSEQIVASMPAGTQCTGGASGNLCLMSMKTTFGFGNCVVVSSNSTASTTSASTGSTAAGADAAGAGATSVTAGVLTTSAAAAAGTDAVGAGATSVTGGTLTTSAAAAAGTDAVGAGATGSTEGTSTTGTAAGADAAGAGTTGSTEGTSTSGTAAGADAAGAGATGATAGTSTTGTAAGADAAGEGATGATAGTSTTDTAAGADAAGAGTTGATTGTSIAGTAAGGPASALQKLKNIAGSRAPRAFRDGIEGRNTREMKRSNWMWA